MSKNRSKRGALTVAFRVIVLVALLAMALAPVGASAQVVTKNRPISSPNGIYIVRMVEPPAALYTGGIAGYAATAPAPGQQLDASAPNVRQYTSYLISRHNAALQAIGGGKKVYDYVLTFNGFAVKLSKTKAAQLSAVPGVAAVTPDAKMKRLTVTTPDFLGLTAPNGLWAQVGGPSRAGEGVVVGILDSGVWPENPSFANTGYGALPRFRGICQTGEEWDASKCNGKIIGARYFNAGWGGDSGVKSFFPYEYNSPRDADGHGSHTASTAAGNYGVPASAQGTDLGNISGMAPRARISVYKVCWGRGDEGGCYNSDSTAAIEAAAMDRVNVINFSISGSTTSVTDPVELSFLGAFSAGVFVAASAGNSGPSSSTVAHNSPWLTTVAAGTHDRYYDSQVNLGDGSSYDGTSLSNGTPVLPAIRSINAGLAGADATQVRLCYPGTLDPAKVTGKIVQCDRGVIARVDKSLAVQQAGGLGMILTNTSPSSLNADLHYVPTIHTDEVVGAAIKAYIDSAGDNATAQIDPGVRVVAEAPTVASFSSRGPARALSGNLLKPDIMTPGVDVLAAVSPAAGGENFNFLSGTSMSSPHMAGLAAAMLSRQPSWSPAMIKSAFMTTASQKTNAGNAIPGNSFGYGAGQAVPNAAMDPGLVYNVRPMDFVAFLCTQGVALDPRCPVNAINATDLNLASIAIGSLAGVQTVRRTVTNVTNSTSTYSVSVSGLSGIDVQVNPSSFTIAPGQSQSYEVTFTRTSATLNSYTHGALIWSDGKHSVRSPVALRPVALAAPSEVGSSGTTGSTSYSVTFGYTGDFAARPHGLVPATTFDGTVADDPGNSFTPGGPGTVSFDVSIPAGTELARFSLFDDYVNPASDIDLYVYKGSTLVGSSGGGTSAEEVNLVKPSSGTYTVWVHGWQTGGPTADFRLFTWAVTATDAGNMTVSAPSSANIGQSDTVTLNWSGLTGGTKYLGTVTYHNVASPSGYDDGRIGTTVVSISTD